MTGSAIKNIREGLGLNAHAFAEIIGVHVSTLYRWEAQAEREARMELLQARILEALARQLKAKKIEQEKLGEDLKKALMVGGALAALYILLGKVK